MAESLLLLFTGQSLEAPLPTASWYRLMTWHPKLWNLNEVTLLVGLS
jgi:hypothetical protein